MSDKPPIDAAGTPQKRLLYAVFDSAQQAQQAERALAAEGIQAQRLAGPEASQQLEAAHDEGGVMGKVTRFVKGFGGEDLEAKRYALHVQHGRVVLVVPAADQPAADRLTRTLTGYGAFDVTFFSDWTIQHMSPAENLERGMPTYESSTGADELSDGTEPKPSETIGKIVDKLYP